MGAQEVLRVIWVRDVCGITTWSIQPHGGLVAIPFVLIVTIAVLDIFTGRDVQLGPLLVIAPALTASSPGHGSPLSPGSWQWRPRCSSLPPSAD